MLNEIYKSFEEKANYIDGWKNMTKTDLANGYCDADESNNHKLADSYFSALMCKYWYMVGYLYRTSKSTKLEQEDFVSWVAESFMVAFKYRRWRDSNFEISKDKNGAEKVINQCITSTRQRWYKHFNQEKRRANFMCESIDSMTDEFGDLSETWLNKASALIIQPEQDGVDSLISSFLQNNDVANALIIDGIVHGDTFKTVRSGDKVNQEFSARKLVHHLNNLDDNTIEEFASKYTMNRNVIIECANRIKKLSNKKLYTLIESTISSLKESSGVKDVCCSIC